MSWLPELIQDRLVIVLAHFVWQGVAVSVDETSRQGPGISGFSAATLPRRASLTLVSDAGTVFVPDDSAPHFSVSPSINSVARRAMIFSRSCLRWKRVKSTVEPKPSTSLRAA